MTNFVSQPVVLTGSMFERQRQGAPGGQHALAGLRNGSGPPPRPPSNERPRTSSSWLGVTWIDEQRWGRQRTQEGRKIGLLVGGQRKRSDLRIGIRVAATTPVILLDDLLERS